MKIVKFVDYIKEDVSTSAPAGVVSPTVSAIPGDVAGSKAGSGDRPAYDTGKSFNILNRKKHIRTKIKHSEKPSGKSFDNMYVTKYTNWKYPKESLVNEESQFHTWKDIDNILDKIIDLGSFDKLDKNDQTILRNYALDDELISIVLDKIKHKILSINDLLKKAPAIVTDEEAANMKNKLNKTGEEVNNLVKNLINNFNINQDTFKRWMKENVPLRQEE